MAVDFEQIGERPEGESLEKKRALDPTKDEDLLGLVADLVAMANTQGGTVLIGEQGKNISKEHIPLFDSARLDDKVNSFVEPRVGGIKSTVFGEGCLLIEVEKSQDPPHVFKKDGNFHDEQRKQRLVFRIGDIFSRHSSKTERANRSDFDRWFEEKRKRLFENVKMVFEAGPGTHVQIAEREGVPVRIAPDAPGAQPVYDLLTAEPFRDLDQELVGSIKAWKTSGQLLNEVQILKAYHQREAIQDEAALELILRSCWERRLTGYYWATRVLPSRLFTVIEDVVSSDRNPASAEALKIASLLPRVWAKALLAHADTSSRGNVKKLRKKLDSVLRARVRKHATLAHLLYPSKRLKYKAVEGTKEVNVDSIDVTVLEEILNTLPAEIRENRAPFRFVELLTYGASLTEVQVEGPQTNGESEDGASNTQSDRKE